MDALLGWLDPMWMVEQFMNGDGLPFVLWTVVVAAASYGIGWKRQERKAFDTDRFTPRQLHVIYECYKASFGRHGFLPLDSDNDEAASLDKAGVVYSTEKDGLETGENGKQKRAVRLTPDWYRYVKKHEDKFKKLYDECERGLSGAISS